MKASCVVYGTGLALAVLLAGPAPASAQTAPSLGHANPYAVLGGSTVTNTGSSTLTGDLGVSPGAAITGFPPGVVLLGTTHAADANAVAAQTDLTTAFNNLNQGCTLDLTGQDLGGKTLTPGVYCYSTSAQLTGTLTLDAQGDPSAVFIIRMGSTLTTASNATVLIINGGQACKVFWRVGSSATLGSGTTFAGNILALTSITLNTSANVAGRALAMNGAVTLDTNNVAISTCAAAGPGCPVITLTPVPLRNGTVGVAYTHAFTGVGGVSPYTFGVTAGALPTGLALSLAGLVTGTPTVPGPFTLSITATDGNGCSQAFFFGLVILNAVPTLPQWGAMLLASGLLGLGYVRLRRRTNGAAQAPTLT